MREKQAYTQ